MNTNSNYSANTSANCCIYDKGIFNNAEAEGLKIEWGGNWKKIKDTPHFEYQTNLTMAQMRERKKHNLPIV